MREDTIRTGGRHRPASARCSSFLSNEIEATLKRSSEICGLIKQADSFEKRPTTKELIKYRRRTQVALEIICTYCMSNLEERCLEQNRTI